GLTTAGNASLLSVAGSILAAGSTAWTEDVIATQLRLSAAVGIGLLGVGIEDPLRTRVSRLAAVAGNDVNLLNSISLTVNSVSVSVQRVGANGSANAIVDVNLADVTTTGTDGSIVIRTLDGSLTLADGGDGNGVAIAANGSG